MTVVWMVRAGRAGQHEGRALEEGRVFLGFRRVPDLSGATARAEIAELVRRAHPDATPSRVANFTGQLYAFRSRMQVGDLVVMPRKSVAALAIGEITGDYSHHDPATDVTGSAHSRAVRWLRDDVARTVVGRDLLNSLGAIQTVCRIARNDAASRVRQLADGQPDPGMQEATPEFAGEVDDDDASPAALTDAFQQLKVNLEYARSLARAGVDLERLGVTAFEVTDVYRAAWVQCVAALDHWVHQELYWRMVALAMQPEASKPDRFRRFGITMDVLERVHQRGEPLENVLAEHIREALGRETFQQPERIREAFGLICDASRLWDRVAAELSDQNTDDPAVSSGMVKERLREIVRRRNRIAHEYDQEPSDPTRRQAIDAAGVTDTIDWIEQLAETILVVIDSDTRPSGGRQVAKQRQRGRSAR